MTDPGEAPCSVTKWGVSRPDVSALTGEPSEDVLEFGYDNGSEERARAFAACNPGRVVRRTVTYASMTWTTAWDVTGAALTAAG